MKKLMLSLLATSALSVFGGAVMALPAAARDVVDFSITLGNAQFGYDDGYYDNDRRWHDWRNDDERDWYRQNNRQSYYQMRRDDDRDNFRRDWREGRRNDWRNGDGGEGNFSVTLGNALFGYDDGYYDNDRRWHEWRNDGERDWYRQNNRQSYYQMHRDDDRDNYRRDWREGRRNDWRNGDGGEGNFSVTLGNAVFGYNDGYYDNNRRWHQWSDDRERDWYRQNRAQNYYEFMRDRDRDNYRREWLAGRRNDWRHGGSGLTWGNVVFGYSDGYYDNNRRWHQWRNRNERNWYRQNYRHSYYEMRRYRDRDNYRRDWLAGRRNDWRVGGGDVGFTITLGNVVYGYSDGYYDNGRRWHGWRSDAERNWYRQNHRGTYYDMSREDERDHGRRDWREGRN